ncbi:MAG: 16S rRNA (uracil(1498)-N(3))-methyltransferase [Treponema sp.]|nr:16S rRNA (uracil(1498)-N(3))-methyltransferase [Treponema sp.]
MNIILLEEHELGHSLARRDQRTIHLLKVLHKKQGDDFEAGVLGGMRGTGRIEKINFDGSILVTMNNFMPPPPRLRLRMAVSFVRQIQLRRILKSLSNIGVSEIDIAGAELGEKSYRDTKLMTDGGARAALIEGAVQARDTMIPALNVYENMDEWLNKRPWDSGRKHPLLAVMDNIRAEGSIFNLVPSNRPVVIAIGPERGWSDRERDIFEKAGFTRLSMGDRALRTDTACIAAATLAMEKIEEHAL